MGTNTSYMQITVETVVTFFIIVADEVFYAEAQPDGKLLIQK